MIVLDTTVLLYAVGEDHPLRRAAVRVIDAIGDRLLHATTTVEVVQEFVHVRARRRPRADAVRLGRRYAALLAPLITPSARELEVGLGFFEHGTIGSFDAVLAATAISIHAEALVSADRRFVEITELGFVDLGSAGLDDLLRGDL